MAITSEETLVEAVKGAAGPISVQGGGTRGLPATGQIMRVAGLQGITLYEPGALTLVAKPGTPVAEIEEALVISTTTMSVACSHKTDQALVARMQEALQSMIDDGTQAEIMAKYE